MKDITNVGSTYPTYQKCVKKPKKGKVGFFEHTKMCILQLPNKYNEEKNRFD